MGADYWKSQGRKFCDFCKCWIADNKPSIEFHEGGKKHKENVSKRLKEIHKASSKQARQNKKFEDDLKKMENAAMAAYLKDVENNTKDMTAERIIQEKLAKGDQQNEGTSLPQSLVVPEADPRFNRRKFQPADERKNRDQYKNAGEIDPCDPAPQPRSSARPSHPPPGVGGGTSGDVKAHGKSNTKGGKAGKGKKAQDEDHTSKPYVQKLWYEAVSPEGYTYYWHIHTNESAWEPPAEGFMTIAEQEEEVREQTVQEELHSQIDKEEAKAKEEALEEQRANAEREKLREIRKERESLKQQSDDGNEEEPAKVYRRDYSVPEKPQPYGSWKTVQTIERKPVDLQLPKQDFVPIVVPQLEREPLPRVFKEKTIARIQTGDSDDESAPPPTFKKRKFGNKNARKRLDDD